MFAGRAADLAATQRSARKWSDGFTTPAVRAAVAAEVRVQLGIVAAEAARGAGGNLAGGHPPYPLRDDYAVRGG